MGSDEHSAVIGMKGNGKSSKLGETIWDALGRWRRSRTANAPDDEALRQLLAEGWASGEPVDGEMALKRLRAKYAAMASGKRF